MYHALKASANQAVESVPISKDEKIASALQRVQDGDSLRQIANDIGISHQGLRKWLLGAVPQQYREAQQIGLISRIVESDQELEDASDSVAIARAREIAKFARWDAERRLPHLFGPKQEVTVSVPTLNLSFGAKVIHNNAPQQLQCSNEIMNGESESIDEEDHEDQ